MKLALLQLNSSADIEENIASIVPMVAEAVGKGAQLIATPECTFAMEGGGAERKYYTQSEHPGVIAACGWAKEYGVWILIGSVFVVPDSMGGQQADPALSSAPLREQQASAGGIDRPKRFNRSLLINPAGEIAASYDKIHLFDVNVGDGQTYDESNYFLPGDKAVVAACDGVTLGLTVCYDLRFPQLYRTLAKAGAQILCVPAAFTQTTGEAHWHTLLKARAIETGCFVIAPAQTGTHAGGRQTYGHSLVVNPWGEVIADGGTDTGLIMAEINLAEIEKVRAKLPSFAHDRDFRPTST